MATATATAAAATAAASLAGAPGLTSLSRSPSSSCSFIPSLESAVRGSPESLPFDSGGSTLQRHTTLCESLHHLREIAAVINTRVMPPLKREAEAIKH